jgi:hypothetical protein
MLIVGMTDFGTIRLGQGRHLKTIVVHKNGAPVYDQDVAMLEVSVHDLGILESSGHVNPGVR